MAGDDFSEMHELAADLTKVPSTANRNVDKALRVTAHHIKDDWRQGAERTGLEKYAADIDYEVTYKPGEIVAEVGPTIGDSGSFGFVEEGGAGVKSAPQHAGRDALEANEPDFVRGLEIAVFDALADEIGG